MQQGAEMDWVPHLVVLKDGQVIDNVLLHGKETFLLGRHQNCDIVAGHASISRHHLEIRVLHGSREILLTDLQSIHGTTINGKPVHPLEPVAMKEDEKFQLGASTRTYMVKWMAVTHEASDSSSSSFTPTVSMESSLMKGFEEEFQSTLKLNSREHLENQENGNNENRTPRLSGSPAKAMKEKPHPDSARRLAFSELNGRSPRSSAAAKPANSSSFRMSVLGTSLVNRKPVLPGSPARKKDLLPCSPSSGNKSPASSPAAKTALRMSPAGKKIFGERSNLQILQDANNADQTPSKLWLRRCNSNPLPTIVTNGMVQAAPQRLPVFKESPDDFLDKLSSSNIEEEDEYPSDKENVPPAVHTRPQKTQESSSSHVERQPFQPLFFLPSPGAQSAYKPVFEPAAYLSSDEDSLGERSLPKYSQKLSGTVGADHIFRRQKPSDSIDLRKQWHIVVDTNCFLDTPAFNSLKQLEGIRETRVLIPKIVIRELDLMKRRNNKKAQARIALRWIEECMVKLPWWIHVQNSNETRPVGATPPVSPSVNGKGFSQYGSAIDLLSPTNDDHILDCALLFERSILDGRVVLLTNDTALKIKAMAEGLVSENSSTFCESLLSPYSERFLWAGSTAHGPNWSDKIARSRSSTPGSSTSPRSKSSLSLSCSNTSTSRVHHAKLHALKELCNHYSEQPRGLQLVLQS